MLITTVNTPMVRGGGPVSKLAPRILDPPTSGHSHLYTGPFHTEFRAAPWTNKRLQIRKDMTASALLSLGSSALGTASLHVTMTGRSMRKGTHASCQQRVSIHHPCEQVILDGVFQPQTSLQMTDYLPGCHHSCNLMTDPEPEPQDGSFPNS